MQEHEVRAIQHDMRGCLNTIRLGVEVIKAETAADDGKYFIDSISREIEKINELIDKLTQMRRQAA